MGDTFIRHFIALIGLLIAGAIYFTGYISGGLGWWWTAIGLIAVYFIIYILVEA